jgi:hypothetical protein
MTPNETALVQRGRLLDSRCAREFLLAGNARVTLVSGKTGVRFTYRVRRPEGVDPKRPHFVALLRGPDNEEDYAFLGTIFHDGHFVMGRNSRISGEAPSARAFRYAWSALHCFAMPHGVEVWHEGRCGRCGRALTVPESVARGLGPECAGIIDRPKQGTLPLDPGDRIGAFRND